MKRHSFIFVVCLVAAAARQADHVGAREAQPPQAGRPLSYAADIAPIVNQHCAVCHRPGQAAPFPLLSYEDVRKRGDLIVKATERDYMPPWHATASPDFPALRDDRRLSAEEKAALKAWVTQGMPAGNLSTAPKPPSFPDGWALGKPDAELRFGGDVEIPADGPDLYRNVVLPLDLPEDRWITAMDYEPTARASVHHALFF